ncbi:MAG: hypothetical protein MJA27_26035 [Pseudanabaenales cyanobacterium]|nr:hypothetical protein [Pseudanabaenales cyanobacterium]
MTASILTNSTDLEVLAQRLHLFLAEQAPGAATLNIRCALSRGKLMVLGEHPPNISFESELIFLSLKQAIHSLLPEIDPPIVDPERRIAFDDLPVQLYLRILGQKQPYAFYRFIWPSKQTTDALSGEAVTEHEQPSGSLPDRSDGGALKAEPGLEPMAAKNTANPKLAEAFLSPEWLQPFSRTLQEIPRWMLGGVAGVFALAGILYGLSGPCVIGRCTRLTTAQTLNRSALALLSVNPSPEDVLKANQELEQAINLLSSIPSWSRHHPAAQSDLQAYQHQAAAVEQLIQAQQRATLASEKSQNPPHPIPDWVGVRMLWRQAIAPLKQIRADSLIYALGQEKLAEYSENLTAIEARIKAEQRAESILDDARQIGQLAMHRTETADSFPSWQLAYKDWRDAVNSLQRIPQGTMAYDEAQQLLANYRRYSAMADDRTRQERLAEQIYNQARSSAHQARDFEQQNQWTLAVTHWRNALDQIQKVPSGATIHADAQAWIAPYRTALSQAETNLRKAITLQKVQQELNQACGASPPICQYIAAANSIRVNVASGYDYAIAQSMTPPPLRGNSSSIHPAVAQQANSLLQTIATVGVNAQMPIELYNAQGQLLARYIPSLAGFVKH